MACYVTAFRGRLELRADRAAYVEGVRTTRHEGARGRGCRNRGVDALSRAYAAAEPLQFGIGHWSRFEKRTRIWVTRDAADDCRVAFFHDAAAVENDDTMGHVADYCEIVRDEQVSELELILKFA